MDYGMPDDIKELHLFLVQLHFQKSYFLLDIHMEVVTDKRNNIWSCLKITQLEYIADIALTKDW